MLEGKEQYKEEEVKPEPEKPEESGCFGAMLLFVVFLFELIVNW